MLRIIRNSPQENTRESVIPYPAIQAAPLFLKKFPPGNSLLAGPDPRSSAIRRAKKYAGGKSNSRPAYDRLFF